MQRPRVLVFEDQSDIADLLVETLIDAGFDVCCLSDGRSASEALDRQTFDALVTDIELGTGPNGWELARLARKKVHNVPVVYMTGTAGDAWTVEGVPLSIIVTKPFAPAQIVNAVATLLNSGALS